jgi:hypothetical protein
MATAVCVLGPGSPVQLWIPDSYGGNIVISFETPPSFFQRLRGSRAKNITKS